jgi:hypothetical protein
MSEGFARRSRPLGSVKRLGAISHLPSAVSRQQSFADG